MPVLEPIPMRVDGELVLGRGLSEKSRERIRLKVACTNYKYVRLVQMGRHPGAEPQRIEATVEMPDGTIHIPRGAIQLVRELLAKDGFSPKCTEDRRSTGSSIFVPDMPLDLRDYQSEGIEALIKNTQGIVVLPCGTGKTLLGVGAVSRLKCTTLILVPTTDLADQWETELKERLSLVLSVGVLSGDRKESNAEIVVAVVDSAVNLLESNQEWGQRFGFVILDEAHGAAALKVQRALRLLPAKYRLGLTATPDREDGLTRIVDWSFGPRLLERSTAEMIKLGILMPANVHFVETGWTFSHDGPESKRITAMEAALSEDETRNSLIADRVVEEAEAGESVLVLCQRKVHVKRMAEMILERGQVALACTSATSKAKRKGTITSLREGFLPIMVATSLADQGLDVKRLSCLVLASPQKAKGRTIQRVGRILRQFKGKNPKCVDFIDSEVPTLERRARERKRVYKEAGLLR